jgi:alpha-2-macroglobulin
MHRLWILLTGLLVVLSVPELAAQPTAETPLQVVETSPFSGEELGRREPLTLFFDQALDCMSAEGALSLNPAVTGSVACEGSMLTFTPDADYRPATTYTLTVASTLQGVDGAALAEPVTLAWDTVGYLAVTEVLPDDAATGIETDALITVIFNRPVVPLVSTEDLDTLPHPLTFEPAVEGQGEWLNTAIYVFRPEPALAGGTEYTVTVNAGLTAVDGATLPQAYRWSFMTLPPGIVETAPLDLASDVRLDNPLMVTFNQAMDPASTESSFFLRPEDETTGSIDGTFEWSDDNTQLTFAPAENLALDTLYTAGFAAGGAQSLSGTAVLAGDTDWSFVTVPAPGIVGTDPFRGEADVDVFTTLTIFFASPMNRDTLRDRVIIEPEPFRDVDDYYFDFDNSYHLSFAHEPSTSYIITLQPGMEDLYGNRIERGRTITYTTAPYDPDVTLQAQRGVGFYNAYNDQTQVFVTHRNVSRLDLQLFEVPTQELVNSVISDPYDPGYSYSPLSEQRLADWVIESTTPENQIRYELLDLGARAGAGDAVACPGAPASRLNVGDSAVVITEPDPVRARSAPVDGDIVNLLYRDYRLAVVGGPVCADDLLWWEVRLRDDSTAWVAEGTPEEYFLEVLTAGQTTPVDVREGLGAEALQPGAYMLRVSSPETLALNYQPIQHFLMVSTASLTVKSAPTEVLVWATDVQTGEPIANAPLTVYERGRGQFATAVTDADGLARIALPDDPEREPFAPLAVVLSTPDHFGVGANSWSQGIEPYQFGFSTDFPTRYRLYLYTDRPVYRPDQPVYFKGVVRRRDDVTYTPPTEFNTVPVRIFDDRGEVIYDEDLPLTPFGTFNGQFDLAADAPLGFYRINVELPQGNQFGFEGGGVSFNVAEFRLPEFQVELTPDQNQVVQNDTIRVLVDSQYFFGGAVSDANVEYNVRTQPYFFDYAGPGRYDFGDFDFDSGPGEFYGFFGEQIASGEGQTDGRGQYIIEIPASLEDITQSQTWTIEATVRDESGLTVAGRTDVVIHKGLIYIGARPAEYVGIAGEESQIELIAVDWESQPVPNQDIAIEVVERRWSSVQEKDELGRTTWTWEVEEIPVTTGSVVTDDRGQADYAFTPPNGGIFKVKISTQDSAGNDVIAATTLWVSSSQFVSWRQQNSNRIDLIADQTDYQIGDTAEILITSPFQGTAEALITVERGKVLTTDRVTMDSNSLVYQLPITEDYAPNVYVSALIVKGVDENNPVAGFRMGMVQLGVETDRKVINIMATPDREQAGPRETVTYTIETTDWQGNPISAEVGVALTDLASLSVGDPNSEPILRFFYGQQGNSVQTSTPLTINTDQRTQTVLDTIKGGGGGFGEGGIFDIRQDFVDTAFWNATVVTGDDGRAEISVRLPDNLTTWRLDTRAVTSGADGLTLVGEATFDLLSTKPLLIRPVTPRFLIVGDVVTLAAIVNNNTDQDLPVEVMLQGTGFTVQGDLSQSVTIPAGGRQRIEWPVTVNNVDSLDLTFSADGGEFNDASKPPLGQGDARLIPVYKYEAPDVVGTAGILREAGSRTEAISLPQRFDVTQGELSLNLDPSLAATTIDGLDYLRNFPHQCIEQTVSRFLPNIMTFRALDQLGVADAELEFQLNQAVSFAVQRLMSQQKANGGWGWFVQDNANPLTTAYAFIGLSEARDAGFAVDDNVIQRAQDFLRNALIVPGPEKAAWELNRQVFVLYALARAGAPDVARTTTLFEFRDRLDYYAQAFLALTLIPSTPLTQAAPIPSFPIWSTARWSARPGCTGKKPRRMCGTGTPTPARPPLPSARSSSCGPKVTCCRTWCAG